MKGEAGSAVQMILEFLIIQLQGKKGEQLERSSMLKGTIVISLDVQDFPQRVNQSHCAAIIAAKGDLCHKILNDLTFKEVQGLLPFCQSGVLHGRGCPHESLHTMPFQLSFQLYEKSEVLKEDSATLKQFIHRTSLMHTTIKFHYCVKVNSNISAETYSPEGKVSTCLPDGTTLLTDGRHFMRSECKAVIPSCDNIHLVTGERVSLFIPDELVDRGFTAGLPVLFSAEEISYSFFEDPSRLASWGKYAYQATLNPAASCKTGDRRVILSHLSPILFCNEQAVKKATQGLVNEVLDQHHRVFQEQQKLARSLPIMASAISRIVSSSTDSEFRRKCLHSLQVADTHEFQESIRETLNKVILNQRKPSHACEIKRPLPRKNKTRPTSIHQKTLCSCISHTGLEAGEGTCEREGLRFDCSGCDQISTTKKRKPANRRIPLEADSEDLNFMSGEAKNQEPEGSTTTRAETTSTSSFPSSSKSQSDIFPDKSQGKDGVGGAEGSKHLCQEEKYLWAREVFNMGKWTS